MTVGSLRLNDNSSLSHKEDYSSRIDEIENLIDKRKENRASLLFHIQNDLLLCESIYPGIIRNEFPDDPNLVNVNLRDIEDWENYLKNLISTFINRKKALGQLFRELDHNILLEKVKKEIWKVKEGLGLTLKERENKSAEYLKKIDEFSRKLRTLDNQMNKEKEWWEQFIANPPKELESYPFRLFIENDEEFNRFQLEAQKWEAERIALQKHLDQYQTFILEWVERLDLRNEQDMAELRQIYVDNANVIGITCLQSGSKDFMQEYRNFDCVIVDEVTKATPVELILPLLKGKKIILVGDHKQLPPMIDQSTFTELAESTKIP